jgi:hypothetical protein
MQDITRNVERQDIVVSSETPRGSENSLVWLRRFLNGLRGGLGTVRSDGGVNE